MHSQVKIRNFILVSLNLINKLHPYAYILKSINIIRWKKSMDYLNCENELGSLDTTQTTIKIMIDLFKVNIKCFYFILIVWQSQ